LCRCFFHVRNFLAFDNLPPSIPASFQRATAYVDKIFRGANPADLPVDASMTFEFANHLKTAKALGLTIPLARSSTPPPT
jgi:hypothetical protein